MKCGDSANARVEVVYSNIGEEWVAELVDDETGRTLVGSYGETRADALRNLADEIEDQED